MSKKISLFVALFAMLFALTVNASAENPTHFDPDATYTVSTYFDGDEEFVNVEIGAKDGRIFGIRVVSDADEVYESFCAFGYAIGFGEEYDVDYIMDENLYANLLGALNYIYDKYGSVDEFYGLYGQYGPDGSNAGTLQTRVLTQAVIWKLLHGVEVEFTNGLWKGWGVSAMYDKLVQDVLANYTSGATGAITNLVYLTAGENFTVAQPQLVPIYGGGDVFDTGTVSATIDIKEEYKKIYHKSVTEVWGAGTTMVSYVNINQVPGDNKTSKVGAVNLSPEPKTMVPSVTGFVLDKQGFTYLKINVNVFKTVNQPATIGIATSNKPNGKAWNSAAISPKGGALSYSFWIEDNTLFIDGDNIVAGKYGVMLQNKAFTDDYNPNSDKNFKHENQTSLDLTGKIDANGYTYLFFHAQDNAKFDTGVIIGCAFDREEVQFGDFDGDITFELGYYDDGDFVIVESSGLVAYDAMFTPSWQFGQDYDEGCIYFVRVWINGVMVAEEDVTIIADEDVNVVFTDITVSGKDTVVCPHCGPDCKCL